MDKKELNNLKAGDRVRIRKDPQDLSWMSPEMDKFKGEIVTIVESWGEDGITIKDGRYRWWISPEDIIEVVKDIPECVCEKLKLLEAENKKLKTQLNSVWNDIVEIFEKKGSKVNEYLYFMRRRLRFDGVEHFSVGYVFKYNGESYIVVADNDYPTGVRAERLKEYVMKNHTVQTCCCSSSDRVSIDEYVDRLVKAYEGAKVKK